MHRPIVAIAVLLLAACGGGGDDYGTGTNTNTLQLTSVNSQALPVTLSTGSGSVQITGGTVSGTANGPICNWRIFRAGASEPATGTRSACPISPTDFIILDISMGGHPWPSGMHSYRFAP